MANVTEPDVLTAPNDPRPNRVIAYGRDSNGVLRPLAVNTSGEAATSYTEDAASPANPSAAALSLRRRDTPVSEVTTDADWVAANGNAYGAAYAELLNSSGAKLDYRTGPDTATQISVASVTTAGGVTISASNALLLGRTITNTDANRLYLYFDAAGTVSASIYNEWLDTGETLRLGPGDYTGVISGIWAADGSGSAYVCALT